MIKILVKKDNDIINSINIKGHALYDVSGKDIVCAAISSITVTTVNAILSFDEKAVEYSEDNNFKLINLKKDDITNKLLSNMVNLLIELESKYQKNINLKEE